MATMTDSTASAVREFKAAVEAMPLGRHISAADADAIYALAYGALQQGRYETAFRYFSLLTLFRPTDVTFLTGLGISYKLMGMLREALGVYAWLALLDPQQPAHTLAVAECELLQRDYAAARKSLDLVIRFCAQNRGHEATASRAQAFRSLISQGSES